jgi:hypothetical protein
MAVRRQAAGRETGQIRMQKFAALQMHSLREALQPLHARKKHFAQMMVDRERRARLAWCGNNLDHDVLLNDNA